VGIFSVPALINAGHNKVAADANFPTDPFNHVILCIPAQKDTTWLECTSNNNKVNELGSFTENKKALLLTANGGVLVNTPRSDYKTNETVTASSITIYGDGGALVRNSIKSCGEEAAFYHFISQLKPDEQKEQMVKHLIYKSPDTLAVLINEEADASDFIVNRTYEKLFDFKAGNKYFFPLCVNKLATHNIKPFKRETAFLLAYPYSKRDTSVFELPQNFSVETVPTNKVLQTEHSVYRRICHYDKTTNRLTVTSELLLKTHVFPAAAYDQLVAFFRDVTSLEEENFILVEGPKQLF
jgi:hypothetical protein